MDPNPTESLRPDDILPLIQIAADQGHADATAGAGAWETILTLWSSGATVHLVQALVLAQVNERAFLAALLRKIFVCYLGEETGALGTYEEDDTPVATEEEEETDPGSFNAIQALVLCGRMYDQPKKLWWNIRRPPTTPLWTDTVPDFAPSDDALALLHETTRAAAEAAQDLDFVIARTLPQLSNGVLGFGQNAEARAYLFCRISSMYAGDILSVPSSPRTTQLLNDVRAFVGRLGALLEQTVPILRVSAARARALPFWLFLVHLASTIPDAGQIVRRHCLGLRRDQFRWVWLDSAQAAPPAQDAGDSDRAVPGLSPLVPIFWTLIGRTADGDVSALSPDDFGWLFAAPFAEVDSALRAHEDSLFSAAWKQTWEPFVRTQVASLKGEPEHWGKNVGAAARALVNLYRCEILTDEDKRELGTVCIRLIALCGAYTPAFEEALLESADRALAREVFTSVIKLLNPFPDDDEGSMLLDFQAVYTDAAYRSQLPSASLPPHLPDRAILVFTSLARRSSPLAHALCDAGLLMLLRAVRDGWYPYGALGDAEDIEPPSVRTMLRERMVEDGFSALSERMYLAAQAVRVREGADGQGLEPLPPPARARVRRRPNWMATGG